MKKFLLYIFFSLSFLLSFAQTGNGYERAVIDFMEVTNAKETTVIGMESMYQNMSLQVNNMHQMCEEIVEAMWPSIIKGYTTIMKEYYTLNELNEIIHFYRSPAGRKFAKYNPEVVQNAMGFCMSSEMVNLIQPIILKYANNK